MCVYILIRSFDDLIYPYLKDLYEWVLIKLYGNSDVGKHLRTFYRGYFLLNLLKTMVEALL